MSYFTSNLIFSTVCFLSNSISYVIFHAAACSFVLFVQTFKIPGEAMYALIKLVRDTSESCFPKLCKIGVDVICEGFTIFFDLAKGRAMRILDSISLTIGNVREKGMPWFDEFLKEWPKVFEGFIEMVSTVFSGLWNNYKDALYYVYRKLLE
ncbi:hypothetical protein EUTSA_v10002922mg [Eutrema salsugineum]|uniref:Uncharacterized protein n=1 Tax=Eutrema salsugineum TaxID=72664 RepID=V4MXC8_EUTSA|nr:hypothetical protein EUTSA_v10002922mg [Eutrema salsugineum]